MLRTVQLSRAQPVAQNILRVTKRFQQSSSSSGTSKPGSATTQSSNFNTPPTAPRTQTATSNPSSNGPIDRTNNPNKTTTTPPPSPSTAPSSPKTVPPVSRPASSSGGSGSGASAPSGGTVKAVAYGVALGLGVTLLYAEYDNGSFRRKVESTLPLSSTILSGLDKVIDPVFGRQKKLTTIISEKLPDVSVITDKLPDKAQLKKAGEKVKDAANAAYDKLPDQKQIEKAGEKAKDAINDAYDMLPEYKKVKGAVNHAVDQVESSCFTRETSSHRLCVFSRWKTLYIAFAMLYRIRKRWRRHSPMLKGKWKMLPKQWKMLCHRPKVSRENLRARWAIQSSWKSLVKWPQHPQLQTNDGKVIDDERIWSLLLSLSISLF